MTRDEIIARLKATAPALRAEGVTGSPYSARAPAATRADSDLDVLIEIDPQSNRRGPALFGVIGDVQRTIAAATGIPTQAEMRQWIEPRFAERIADDLIEIF